MKICSVLGCENKFRARGFCAYHYQRFRSTEEFCTLPAPVKATCSVPGCDKEHKARGYCDKHYQTFQRHGEPEGGRPKMTPRTDGLKVCSNCRIPKDPKCFHKYAAAKDGLFCYCKPCNKLVSEAWGKENAERRKARGKLWKQENREKTRAYDRKAYWKDPVKTRERKKNPALRRKSKLLCRFGLTLEDYDRMLVAQMGVCAICGQPENSSQRKNLSVDHCHKTGKIRGLLCGACNLAVGNVKESPEIGRKLVSYIEKHLKLSASGDC